MEYNKIIKTDSILGLKQLKDNSIDCIITSPPYNKCGKVKTKGLIWNVKIEYDSYNDDMPEELYQKWQIEFLNECFRVLKDTGSIFYNHKSRRFNNEIITPDEWLFQTKFKLNQIIIWDRKSVHNQANFFLSPMTEYFYWLVKSDDFKCYKERLPLEYQGNVWSMCPERNPNHPAPFNIKLPELCLELTTDEGDVVLDTFMGSGSTAVAAKRNNRKYYGFDISDNYIDISNKKLEETSLLDKYINNVNNIKSIENKQIKIVKDIKTVIINNVEVLTDELSKNIYENLLDNGSLFVRFNDINFLNTEYYKSLIKNKLKKFQLIIVKTSLPLNNNKKLNDNTEFILWMCKKVPEKFKPSLEQAYKKELWFITDEKKDEIILNNLSILTTNKENNSKNKELIIIN